MFARLNQLCTGFLVVYLLTAWLPAVAGNDGIVRVKSAYPIAETIERLKKDIADKGIKFFDEIDQSRLAANAGIKLRPSVLLIFGNPKAGTPLMQGRQTIGLDLPLRALVWEDGEGKVWLTYRRVEELARRHHVTGQDETVKALDDGLAGLARAATAR